MNVMILRLQMIWVTIKWGNFLVLCLNTLHIVTYKLSHPPSTTITICNPMSWQQEQVTIIRISIQIISDVFSHNHKSPLRELAHYRVHLGNNFDRVQTKFIAKTGNIFGKAITMNDQKIKNMITSSKSID